MSEDQNPPDPYIESVEAAIKEVEQHAAQNRAHQEQGLYTEALPRIAAALRRILEAIDAEADEADDQPPEPGAFVLIRYQTASALETLLTQLFQQKPDQERLASVLFLLLEDLHGINEEEIINLLKQEQTEEQTEEQAPDAENTKQ